MEMIARILGTSYAVAKLAPWYSTVYQRIYFIGGGNPTYVFSNDQAIPNAYPHFPYQWNVEPD